MVDFYDSEEVNISYMSDSMDALWVIGKVFQHHKVPSFLSRITSSKMVGEASRSSSSPLGCYAFKDSSGTCGGWYSSRNQPKIRPENHRNLGENS